MGSVEKYAIILMGLPFYVICSLYNLQYSFSVLCASCFNNNMLWSVSLLIKAVWCLGSLLYLSGQFCLNIWKFFCYYFVEYIMYTSGMHFFSLNAHDLQVWSFDAVTDFLHISFTALEFFD
jgi:hypothetical protein